MITPSFSLTATERVLPKLALDFTTASLDSRITFTRALDTATVTNSSGYVVPINANLPRFDYDPITLVCKGLLIEESRANLILDSSNYSTANWIRNRSSTATSAVLSPDGTNTALFIAEDTTFGAHGVSLNTSLTVTIGQTYTMSVFAKAGTNGWIIINFFDTSAVQTYFNVTTGAIGTIGSGCTAAITPYGNGWYRCSVTKTMTTTSLNYQILTTRSNGLYTYAGATDRGNYFWGSQLELGAFATSYIPTTSAALTRNADVASMTGTNFSDWYNATEGTAQAQFIFASEPGYTSGGSSQRIFEFSDGSTNNRWLMYRNESVSDRIYYLDASGGSLVVNTSADTTNTTNNTVYKAAMAAKNSSFAAAFNGNTPATFSSGNISTGVNQLFLGKALSNGYLNGWLQKFSYYPQRLTNAEVQAISK